MLMNVLLIMLLYYVHDYVTV